MGDRGGFTVWTGTALNCPGGEIVLPHRRFTEQGGIARSCNNGATVAQTLFVQDNLYISQLNVIVTHSVAQKTIVCIYIDGTADNASPFSTSIQGIIIVIPTVAI